MTRYAKLLILANLGLSLVFVAWAFGLASERLPWAPSTGDGEKVRSQVEELTATIEGLNKARAAVDARWFTATRDVIKWEQDLPKRKAFFAETVKMITTGTDAAG